MAFTSGTATSYIDLMNRFITFVTTGINATENWTVLTDRAEDVERVVYFKAPGLSGTENIYLSFHRYSSGPSDYYNFGFSGYTGHIPATPLRSGQPGYSGVCRMMLWNTSIPYWFVASGRRAIIVAKVSTVYQCAYIGHIVPYASPSEWAYPVFVGGCAASSGLRWSDTSGEHRAFFDPEYAGTGTATAQLWTPSATWLGFRNYNGTSRDTGGNPTTWPYFGANGSVGNNSVSEMIGKLYDGSGYSLMPIALFNDTSPNTAIYGEFDGLYYVSGVGNASENIITISGQNYLVFQNTFRTASNNYAALKLS